MKIPHQLNINFELCLERETNSSFVNNYFEEGLLAWETNIDKYTTCVRHYKAVQYMCVCFLKLKVLVQMLSKCKELEKGKFDTNVQFKKLFSS